MFAMMMMMMALRGGRRKVTNSTNLGCSIGTKKSHEVLQRFEKNVLLNKVRSSGKRRLSIFY